MEEGKAERERMVSEQIFSRDIEDEQVLEAMRTVPRHRFVPDSLRRSAYMDNPLPIGCDQTISQPYMVAAMTTLLSRMIPDGGKVLEIGSGSGYQTAILVHMGFEVHSVEVVPELLSGSKEVLRDLDLMPASMTCGDGHLGLPDLSPFDGIIVAACARRLPKEWGRQLKDGGVVVAPLKTITGQHLFRWEKRDGRLVKENIMAVRFVPLTSP